MKRARTSHDEELSPLLRRYLYLTAGITGAAIMIVEILGAKILAPYVGTSHFVWTAQIAVTLVALALGYYVGGALVDRTRRLGQVYAGIVVAAVYLCLTITVAEPVAYWCLQYNLALGSLLASLFLFLPPLSLLAMVGPFSVRILTASLGSVGGTMGRLTAISTLGSLIGTLLIGYVLIPLLMNSTSMYLTAATLVALGLGYFVAFERRVTPLLLPAAVGLTLGCPALQGPPHFARSVQIGRANSAFGLLQVLDDAPAHRRYLLDDYLMQGSYDPVAKQSLSPFTDVLHELARGYTRHIQRVLCIGLGIGSVPMQFAAEGARVDVVEINPAVVRMAEQYFDLQPQRMHIVIDDGRRFINRSGNRYDTVILDAFVGDSSPSHLMTRNAFVAIHRLLNPGGTLVVNSIGHSDPDKQFLVASLEKTLQSVFRSVRVHRNRSEVGVVNVFFVASDQDPLVLSPPDDWQHVHPQTRAAVRASVEGVVSPNPDAGVVLTDQYDPIEIYDSANREELRRDMAHLIKRL